MRTQLRPGPSVTDRQRQRGGAPSPASVVAASALGGAVWGVLARAWMHVLADNPSFTWSGTLTILAISTLTWTGGGVVAVAKAASRWRRRVAITAGVFLLCVIGASLGLLLLPTAVLGGAALGSVRWRRGLRVALGVLAAVPIVVGIAAIWRLEGNGVVERLVLTVATPLLCLLLCLPYALAFSRRFATSSATSTATSSEMPSAVPSTTDAAFRTPPRSTPMSRNRSLRAALLFLVPFAVLAVLLVVVIGVTGVRAADTIATVTLRSADGSAVGTLTFVRDSDPLVTRVEVTLRLPRAATGFHGLHLHANDSAANGVGCVADPTAPASTWFVSADGHYRRDTADSHPNHAGDLPSVWVNRDGTSSAVFVIDRIQPGELFDRAVVLHAGPDNFANVPVGDAVTQYKPNTADATVGTRNTGNAGDRLACGVVDVRR